MSILSQLVRASAFGADGPAVAQVDTDTLDPSSTPVSLYVLLKSGGAIVWRPEVVEALRQRGFSIESHELLPDEARWLSAHSPNWSSQGSPALVWFASCPLTAGVDTDGLPTCGATLPSGASEIPPRPGVNPCSIESLPEEARGEIRAGPLETARSLAPAGATVCYRYFGGNPPISDALKASAAQTVRVYDQLLRSVEQVETQRRTSGRALSLAQQATVSQARAWLSTYSQPVQKARPYLFPEGSTNRRPPKQQPARARFGVEPTTVAIIVVIAVATVALAIAWLGDSEVRAKGIAAQQELNRAMQPVISELSSCVTDPSRTDAQRQACVDQLHTLADLAPGMQPDAKGGTDWGQIAKYAVIGTGIVAGVYLVGPAVRAASKATAASLDTRTVRTQERTRLLRGLST